jgi:Domain of Unknown Function (DUF1206)
MTMRHSNIRAARAPVQDVKSTGDSIAHARWFEWLARAGLVARGAIYGIIGVLALEVAFGAGGKTTNQKGALAEISQQSGGKILLVLMAIGLFGYAFWRLLRAAVGHGPEETDDGKERLKGLASGIAYASLFITCLSILFGSSSSGGSGHPDKATGGVLAWPGGQVIVAIAGLVLIGVGLFQAYDGLTEKFLEKSKTQEMSEKTEKAFTALGIAGHLARAVVFALIGYFLIKAAIDFDPDKAVSVDGALAALAKPSYGPVLLGIVATGMVAFAAYSVADARYRRV